MSSVIGNLPSGHSGDTGIPIVQAIKNHITTPITAVTVDTWTDFTGFTNIPGESNGAALSLNIDNKTIDISEDGLYHFGGCIHYQNNSVGLFGSLTILSRIFINGTDEARCSQRGCVIDFASGGEEVLSYNGTAYLKAGDNLTLQYYTDEASLDFFSNSNFGRPVAATIWLMRVGSI